MDNFGIDTLVSYTKEKINDTLEFVNSAYRTLEIQLKKVVSKLNHRKAKFANYELGKSPQEKRKQKGI